MDAASICRDNYLFFFTNLRSSECDVVRGDCQVKYFKRNPLKHFDNNFVLANLCTLSVPRNSTGARDTHWPGLYSS